MKVCVIGAGIAGLVTAKTLTKDGFDVHIIECDSNLGGTWAPSRIYPGLRTNNSKLTYAFSDFPYPDSVDTFPYAEDVRSYLESYADHFSIRSRIRFNQEVFNVSRVAGDGDRLEVTSRSTLGESEETIETFDFVVICNGVFHIPNIPAIEGRDEFGGRVLHSSEVTESTYKPDEKVIVVGSGKSALDCAAWAARNGVSPTLVFRQPHWMAPRFLPGGIPGDWFFFTRFMELFLRYYHSDRIERFMHSVGKQLVRLWWGLYSFLWRKEHKMPAVLTPDHSLPVGIERVGVGGDIYAAVNEGLAEVRRGSIIKFEKDGILLDNGDHLPADSVIFATGWQQSVAFLSADLRNEIVREGRFRLYRQLLPPRIKNIGFNGYASSFACQLNAEIGAHWLSEHFLGTLKLPSVNQMNEEIDRAHLWADENLPYRGTEGFVGPHLSHYVDDLIRDMGLETKRKSNFIKEYLTTYLASRFANLNEERRRAREQIKKPTHFYFSALHALLILGAVILLWLLYPNSP